MELVKLVPLYYVVMLESRIIVIELLFILAPIHIVDGVKSRTQIPRAT